MPAVGKRKTKWTVTVPPEIDSQIDFYLKKHKKERISRSTLVARAVQLWLAKVAEEEEEAYYKAHAAELNNDSKSWSRITTEAAKHIWK